MKIAITFIGLALFSTAHAASFNGSYKISNFKSVPATLSFTGGKVTLRAAGAPCVVSFGSAVFAGQMPDNSAFGSRGYYEVYDLPVLNSCGAPNSFRYKLVFMRDADGGLQSITLKGTTGKNHWTYFSGN